MALQLEQTTEGDVTIVKFLDKRIADEPDIIEFGESLTEVVSSGEHKKVLLNFTNVDFLSSAAIGKLVMINKKSAAADVALRMCCINKPNPYEGFKITKLDMLFKITDTQDEAIAAFA